MDFKPVTLKDREIIVGHTYSSDTSICDYSFSNLYSWSFLYKTSWAIIAEHLVVRFFVAGKQHPLYLFPLSTSNTGLTSVIEYLANCARLGGYPLTLMSVCSACKEQLEASFPGAFHYFNDRNWTDYIYLRENLATLAGKKLQSKRNHVNRFIAFHPDFQYEPITPDNTAECLSLSNLWMKEHGENPSVLNEQIMLQRALSALSQTGSTGGAIRIDGRVVAFSVGTPINRNTFGISIEKADIDVPGAFNIINREFARRIPEQYTYINREEDLGIEGLRNAKLSYRPEVLLTKETAILRKIY